MNDVRNSHLLAVSPPAPHNLQPYSPIVAWLDDQNLNRLYNPLGTSPLPRTNDGHSCVLEFELRWAKSENGGTRTRGNRNQNGGTGNKERCSDRGQQLGLVDASKPKACRNQKSKRLNKDESGTGNDPPNKRRSTNPDSQLRAEFFCRIYLLSDNTERKCKSPGPFASFQGMVEHLLRAHLKAYQCLYCWSRFGRKSERKRHQDEVCIPKRNREAPNRVPDYVVEFSEKVRKSTEGNIDDILFLGGRKQYDIIDGTDEMRPPLAFWPIPSDDDEILRLLRDTPASDILTPGLGDLGPEDLTPQPQEIILAQLEQRAKLAEQLGPNSLRQFARQIAARLPPSMLQYIIEYQITVSPVAQMGEGPSGQQDFITLPQLSLVDSGTDTSGGVGSDSGRMRWADQFLELDSPSDNPPEANKSIRYQS